MLYLGIYFIINLWIFVYYGYIIKEHKKNKATFSTRFWILHIQIWIKKFAGAEAEAEAEAGARRMLITNSSLLHQNITANRFMYGYVYMYTSSYLHIFSMELEFCMEVFICVCVRVYRKCSTSNIIC